MTRATIVLAMVLGLAAVGCGKTEGNPSDAAVDSASGVTAHFSSLYGDYLSNCKNCHTPTAPGRTSDTEQTLDFTSKATAYMTLTTGQASGLVGNQMSCNGVPFITSGQPAQSLLVATLDQDTRSAFDLSSAPNCDMSAISDQTVKVGSAPSTEFIAALKQWIQNGAAND